MSKINFILFVIFVNAIWAQTQTIKLTGRNAIVNCGNDTHCKSFMGEGATCKDKKCVCENDDLCKIHKLDARVKSNVIGEECGEDENCNIQFSVCTDSFCVCSQDRVPSIDGHKCLKVSDGLGKECNEDSQCIKTTKGSVCRNNVCVCDEFHHQVPNSSECFVKAGLGQECKDPSQCDHISHGHCGPVFCECDSGFVESASRTKCLPTATEPLGKCEEVIQCRHLYGHGALCMYGRCECDAVHRLANQTACPSRLKQVCIIDDECRSFKDDRTMHCDEGRCECKVPFVEQNGVCNGSANVKPTILSNFIVLIFILIQYFK